MPEMGLVLDAAKSLDNPFLVVVVGEFNAGKSSVINALLGGKYAPNLMEQCQDARVARGVVGVV